jgi:epoxyqueuosine reductase
MAPTSPSTHRPPSASQEVKRRALALGFDLVGIAPAQRAAHADFYLAWLKRGYHGAMAYLERRDAVERRLDPSTALPGARAIVAVAMNYSSRDSSAVDDGARAIVARYARGADYHQVFEEKLEQLAASLREFCGVGTGTRAYVDYGPVLERDHAQRAGLGWIGKNTVLINPAIGSYLVLGVILTDAELEPDEPFLPDHCGTCNRCIQACPTGAIVAPRELDARLCISYLTIELRGPIPRELRPFIANRIFGCDICQEVCPWNRETPATRELRFQPRSDLSAPDLVGLANLDEAEFRERYSGTAIERAKRNGFVRNVAVALGNWGDPAALAALITSLNDDALLVRGHAAWALGCIATPEARSALQNRLQLEGDDWVREEIQLALQSDQSDRDA